uniref:U-box domain-containing protein 11 n=1 Tax=Rhizophora mucronata TaxID=61149 RepID=A0A2P2P9L7_RHIMU
MKLEDQLVDILMKDVASKAVNSSINKLDVRDIYMPT